MTAHAEAARRIKGYARAFARKRAIEAALGRTARLLFAPFRPLARRRAFRDDRLLVVERILRIGDTLVARPAVAALRARYPGAEVAVVCQSALAPLCRADALIDGVFIAPPGLTGFVAAAREARAFAASRAYILVPDRSSPYLAWSAGAHDITGYDYARRGVVLSDRRPSPPRANVPVFLYPPETAPLHAAAIWLALVAPGAAPPSSYPPFDPGDDARNAARDFLERAGVTAKRPLILLHPGAANAAYLWREDRWGEVGRELAADGAALVVTGAAAEQEAASRVAANIGRGAAVAAGRLSLLEMFALVAAADLVITLDTAPAHIAATMGTPAAALYGPGDEVMWAPLGIPARLVVGDAACRGCKAAWCFQNRHYCMEAITADAVLSAARELLTGGKR